MFAAVQGTHAKIPGEIITTVVKLGESIPPALTITKILVVAATEIEAFTTALDPTAFA